MTRPVDYVELLELDLQPPLLRGIRPGAVFVALLGKMQSVCPGFSELIHSRFHSSYIDNYAGHYIGTFGVVTADNLRDLNEQFGHCGGIHFLWCAELPEDKRLEFLRLFTIKVRFLALSFNHDVDTNWELVRFAPVHGPLLQQAFEMVLESMGILRR